MKIVNKWNLMPQAPEEFFRSFPLYPPQILQVLARRDIFSIEAVEEFFAPPDLKRLPNPFLYKDMKQAVERLLEAKRLNEHVVIFGDYDTDGACGTTILFELLALLKIKNSIYLPDRLKEGHGLGPRAVEEIINRRAALVITVDCGASSIQEVVALKERGIDTVVLDHHLVLAELPKAVALIDAQRHDDKYPFDWLCGAGVAFAFADAVGRHELGKRLPKDFLHRFLDLVAIATVADMVPLTGPNRLLVRAGLEVLKRTKRPGLRALCSVARLNLPDIDAQAIAFDVGPRLNSASRIDHANSAFKLLSSTSEEEAFGFAKALDRHNRTRQKQSSDIFKSIVDDLDGRGDLPTVIVASSAVWSPTVVSGVASRLVERYGRPAFVFGIRDGVAIGSGRSLGGFDIVSAMRACGGEDLFKAFGGHSMAAGCSLPEKWIPLFNERIQAYAENTLSPEMLVPELSIDLELEAHEISPQLLDWFNKLEPFGKENPRPKVLIRHLEIVEAKIVGRGERGLSLKLLGPRGGRIITAIAWSRKQLPTVRSGDTIDMVGELYRDNWRGRGGVLLKIVDARFADAIIPTR